jgi:hypothetical protein
MPDALNIVDPSPTAASRRAGDVPEEVRRRYLTEERDGPGVGYYRDAREPSAAFRDHGGRLATDRSDPHIVRDLVAIARHRGWTTISVRGQTEFRREVYLLARAAGLEVRGYRPTERDRQQAERRRDAKPPPLTHAVTDRLRVVETVVRNRVVEPAEQNRILAAARSRLAQWLERGAAFAETDRRRSRDVSR